MISVVTTASIVPIAPVVLFVPIAPVFLGCFRCSSFSIFIPVASVVPVCQMVLHYNKADSN